MGSDMSTQGDPAQEIFAAALPLTREERILLLDRRCEGAPELRHAVEALLAASDETGGFVEKPLLAAALMDEPGDATASFAAEPSGLDADSPFEIDKVIFDRFKVLRFIARGGMGEVWEAWDSQLQERVALKTIRADMVRQPEVVERFRREVRQARAISHPNICRIHELFTYETASRGTGIFLCMEFLDGPTLSEYLRHNGPFEPDAAFGLVQQLVQGLNSAHALGVVHRDLKSRNIMLVSAGPGKLRAVITDFGLALNVLTPNGGLEEGSGQGTPDYMAPEQELTGNVTALADQYALGVVMCEMITGSRPVRTQSNSSGKAVGVKLPAKSIPVRWANVIERSLATRPEDRFPRLDDVLLDLRPPPRKWPYWAAGMTTGCLLLGTVGWVRHHRPVEATSLAVLPLHNASGDSSVDYVGSGFTEALTNDLAGMPGLQVKAAGIAERYAAQSNDPSESGRRLKVKSVVSGSLFEAGGHVRIPIEIIDVSTGSQIWGQTYEGDISNLAGLQNEISTDVAYHLKVRLNPDQKARLQRQYTTNSAAYNAYLKGRYRLTQRTDADLLAAVTEFQSALNADPHYAPAYAGLAESYNLLAHYRGGNQIPMMKNALNTADQALALDPTLGEAYASRASARIDLNYDWKGGESDYQRALELNPNDLNAHIQYAVSLLAPLGRDAEAQVQMAYVQAVDPNSLLTTMSRAWVAQCGGRTAESARLLEEQLKTTPNFEEAIETLAVDYIELKRPMDAIHLLRTAPLDPTREADRAIMLSIAYAHAGNHADAAKWLKQASENGDAQNTLPYQAAVYYTSLGKHPKALDLLDLAYARRDSDLPFVNVDPLLMPLHSDPRFHQLLGRMNIE
ncbi:MAG TPA: protein kinase [Acidobacteriaceae bacterium]|nr:protein kinase [Acidobacteriaceae bacterium]